MQEQTTPAVPKVRAQKKHVILFGIACMLLAISLAAFFVSMTNLPSDSIPPDESGSDSLAMLGAVIMLAADIFTIIGTLLLCSLGWGVGMIISAHLAFRKQDKPRWLWIGSTVLTVIFTVLVMGVLLYFGSILLALLL